jgi:ABC-type sugar transport system substrate-binding protein
MRVDFVVANTTVGEASNTWTIAKGTDVMFTALTATSDGLVSYCVAGASAATAANRILAAGDVVKVGAAGGSNGANQRGIITFIGHRL